MFVQLFLVVKVLLVHVALSAPLNGVWHIGEGVDILSWQVKPSPFVLSYFAGQKTPDGKNDMPDGTFFMDIDQCNFAANTVISSTYNDYIRTNTFSTKVSGSFSVVSGSLSVTSTSIREHMYKSKDTMARTNVNCVEYDISMFTGSLPLNSYFNQSLFSLPSVFNASSEAIYMRFLSTWGTHYRTRISLGGKMSQVAFTTSSYTKDHTVSDLSIQASARFYVSVDATSSKKTEITAEYEHSTTTSNLQAEGGAPWKAGAETWTTWASTVPTRPVVVYQELESVSSIAGYSGRQDLKNNLDLALKQYSFKRGCTHPGTPTYDPTATVDDGSCKDKPSIPPQLQCTGSGLFHTIPDGCIDDGGLSGKEDSLQLYCCGGELRFCLSGEGCPWRSGCPASYDDKQCSRSGLRGSFMATVTCDNIRSIRRVGCDANEQVKLN